MSVLPSIEQRREHVKKLLNCIRQSLDQELINKSIRELKSMIKKYEWRSCPELLNEANETIDISLTGESSSQKSINFLTENSGINTNSNIKVSASPVSSETSIIPLRKNMIKRNYSYRSFSKDKIKIIEINVNPVEENETSTVELVSLVILKEQIETEDFINEFYASVKELLKHKRYSYTKRIEDLQTEYTITKKKADVLSSKGMPRDTIKELLPGYDYITSYILDIETIIETIDKNLKIITKKLIKEKLHTAIYDVDRGLESLIGRDDVKDSIASWLYSFSQDFRTFYECFNNIIITGCAGLGKTHIAKTIAFVFSNVYILANNIAKIVTKAEFIASYVGQTSAKTRGLLVSTLEGVLFVDEAHELTSNTNKNAVDFGSEAITELVNFLDKYIGLNIVIIAGYEDLIYNNFLKSNEGLSRRFPYRYKLKSYTVEELCDILIYNLKKRLYGPHYPSSVESKIKIDRPTENYLYGILNNLSSSIENVFKNQAGDMLNLSSNIVNCINSSYNIKWKNFNLKNNEPILLLGVNKYLETKGYHIST